MKKYLLILGFVTQAYAGNGQFYLGGAFNLGHCAQLAGAYGYRLATFGAGFDDRGVYYPYWNACFGSNGASNGGNGQVISYDVFVRQGEDLNSCADDIEWQVADVRCKVSSGANYLHCISRNGGKKNEIERVRCVDRAYRLQPVH